MIDLHGRLRCPRCGSGALLDWESDRLVIRCLLCAWQAEGSSRREVQARERQEADGLMAKSFRPGRPRKGVVV